MSGVIPARIAASFTQGEVAALTVVARTVQKCGVCVLPIDAIAALAGVSRTTAQNALRQARRLGLIEVKERRRRGLPSMTNVIRVIAAEWLNWLKIGEQGGGFRKSSTANSSYLLRGERTGTRAEAGRSGKGKARLPVGYET
jgi:DNA-binding transcriptional MocR family regulator